MQLHLIRHPRPAIAPGICYGQTDLGLAESAVEVAARLRPLLPGSFTLHASPLARARLLAEELGAARLDERLKEIDFGDWEGRSFTDIGSAIDDWAANPLGFRAPGGESVHEMTARVLQWLHEVRAGAQLAETIAAPGPDPDFLHDPDCQQGRNRRQNPISAASRKPGPALDFSQRCEAAVGAGLPANGRAPLRRPLNSRASPLPQGQPQALAEALARGRTHGPAGGEIAQGEIAGGEIGICPRLAALTDTGCAPPGPQHLVVVAHGGPLRVIAGHLLGLPPERWLGLDFGCGQVTRIDMESWGVVLKWFNR